ncbi:sigma 54 modulation/S30EA ribosomal C-terminal domain-containing protein [Streptomyces sp. NBC_00019]|uniref:sigma 54 modulation/S30EA ribosomal C-terminal domain-containing protein n=1 Tax=Streptomyces sp. NBC_00019 TaxID=2975623 RepID=UPI003864C9A4
METPHEAVFEMESMDYGFRLFTDADSGEDSVLCSARGCPGPGHTGRPSDTARTCPAGPGRLEGRAEVPTSELPGSGVRRVATVDRTEGGW